MVHFHKGKLWDSQKDETDLWAAVEEYPKNTEWKSKLQNSVCTQTPLGEKCATVQLRTVQPCHLVLSLEGSAAGTQLPDSFHCTFTPEPMVPADCSQPKIKPNLFCPIWDSSNRHHSIEVSPLAWAKHSQNCTADGSSSFSLFPLPCHLALGLPPPAPLPVHPSPGLSPQISCTSISALLSSTLRIQTGPKRHTQLQTLIKVELGWDKGREQDEGNYS